MIDLCKKYLPLGGARVQTPMSEETLTKEMSLTTDQQKLEMTKIPYRQKERRATDCFTGGNREMSSSGVMLKGFQTISWILGIYRRE